MATLLDKEAINAACREENYFGRIDCSIPSTQSICSFSRYSTRTPR